MYDGKYYRPNWRLFLKRRWRTILALIINSITLILILSEVLSFYFLFVSIAVSSLVFAVSKREF
ncbi:MAG: hypothetical protein KGD64_05030 [Candidatus Heimdallarchaeota archaeon]|nr:hypothetical protein [Candidatus Heimdallarchaeota archaeon]